MAFTVTSSATASNRSIKYVDAKPQETNVSVIQRLAPRDGVLLIGGSRVGDFRIRVAQSHLRHDLLPSYWSAAGVLRGAKTVATVGLGTWRDVSDVPSQNAIETVDLQVFDDPQRYPNIAVLQFSESIEPALAAVERLKKRRSVIDLPDLVLAWLGFVWSAGDRTNPVLSGKGVPSAALVETAFAMAGVELTPGLASGASCPEAIWQAAKWWHGFYSEAAERTAKTPTKAERERVTRATVPRGYAVLRQPGAAVLESSDGASRARGRRSSRT